MTDMTLYEYDRVMDTRGWGRRIPFLDFPEGWKIKVIPPFGGAVIRFLVSEDGESWVSIYMDGYENLGYFGGEPYWEVYPVDGDVGRVELDETDALLEMIGESLEEVRS